ncbi:MAG: DUF4892 domain-containing protein [Gammaproteobacteria bacterium]
MLIIGRELSVTVAVAAMIGGWSVSAIAAEPGADHPLVGRFESAKMTGYEQKAFDEYPLIVRQVTRYGGIEKNLDATQSVEGRLTRITYQAPKEHSTLEVFRAYRDALAGNGFESLFECADHACGGRNFNHASPGYRAAYRSFGENDDEQRYLAARLTRPQGDVFAAVHTVRNTTAGGPTAGLIYTQVDVVEIQAQTSKVVVIEAAEMASRIEADGKVALYGLYFETDEAVIKAESGPTLDEIGKLLKDNPDLELLVVGHTDNQGTLEYNIDLSRRRAASVTDSLVEDHEIDAARLLPWGVGFAAPVASNATENGRASNRRVELVRR